MLLLKMKSSIKPQQNAFYDFGAAFMKEISLIFKVFLFFLIKEKGSQRIVIMQYTMYVVA